MNPEVPNPNRVLVIDDSESIHRLIRARLVPENLEVTGELDPEAGIERAIEDTPDLILLDVGLPIVDGFEVCRRLKEHPSTRNIPIVFLTGATETESKVKGLDLGAVDYVTKPFDQFELRARVRAALRTKRLQDILEQQSFLDGLTGLWNRSYLDRRLDAELNVARRYGRPLSLVLGDIDNFKNLNDTYGHLFGDVVLQGISEGLRAYARRSDIVARYGGEEFAVLLTDTNMEAAIYVAERLRASAESRNFEARAGSVTVTASFGMACTDDMTGDLTPEALINAADVALYASKDSGRNCVHLNRNGELIRCESGWLEEDEDLKKPES
ncbi:MAG: diguanylate cyclase [bacterium]|nr:diguanylate cyclase [bacterium]